MFSPTDPLRPSGSRFSRSVSPSFNRFYELMQGCIAVNGLASMGTIELGILAQNVDQIIIKDIKEMFPTSATSKAQEPTEEPAKELVQEISFKPIYTPAGTPPKPLMSVFGYPVIPLDFVNISAPSTPATAASGPTPMSNLGGTARYVCGCQPRLPFRAGGRPIVPIRYPYPYRGHRF